MKYKILIILLIGTILTSAIYFNSEKNEINLLALGDGISTGMTSYHVEGYDFNDYLTEYLNESKKLDKYYKFFNETDETLNTLITKIDNNVNNIEQKIKIKQAIKKADIITLAIGMDELNNYASKSNLGSTKINGFLKKYNELLKKIRNLNDKKIFVIGLYNSNKINISKIEKINIELENITKKYNCEFIDIENITEYKEFFTLNNNYYLNYKGQKYIYEIIKNKIESLPVVNIV